MASALSCDGCYFFKTNQTFTWICFVLYIFSLSHLWRRHLHDITPRFLRYEPHRSMFASLFLVGCISLEIVSTDTTPAKLYNVFSVHSCCFSCLMSHSVPCCCLFDTFTFLTFLWMLKISNNHRLCHHKNAIFFKWSHLI